MKYFVLVDVFYYLVLILKGIIFADKNNSIITNNNDFKFL